MLISLQDIKKDYYSGEVVTKVLHGISFEVAQGEFVSIMGPSGSGKSSIMHILGFLDRPTSGVYKFQGKDVSQLSDDELAQLRNKKVGFVFQAFNLLNKINVLDNVKLPLVYSREKIGNMDERARKMLESVGLEHRLKYFPNQLSGGEKQRVAIARALVNEPDIIFADEPTGNLDSKSGIQVMKILQELNQRGKTIVLVTHETFTAEHAKRLIKILDGRIISDQKIAQPRVATEEQILK